VAVRSESAARRDSVARRRWIVHLALLLGFAAALLSLIELTKNYLGHSGITDHAIIGVAVFVLVVVHLIQRRHTVGRLLARLAGRSKDARTRLATSDMILWLLTFNVTVSGVADFVSGHEIFLPIPGPFIFQKWHEVAALVLVVYVIVHVIRRWSRLRNSRIS
jgi:hypothetical protein